jgi:hypothetical protein
MVGARGFEPPGDENTALTQAGQEPTQAGHKEPQTGKQQGDRNTPPCTSRTIQDASPTKAGLSASTILAQQEMNLPIDLARLVEIWPSLPEKIRTSIMTIVEASVEK